jgi:hypothetical protein
MATCPKCFGALTDDHRCPRSATNQRLLRALWPIGFGGTAGVVFTLAVVERPASALVVASAALGAVLASAVSQAVGGGR